MRLRCGDPGEKMEHRGPSERQRPRPAAIAGKPPIIMPGHTFASLTDEISSIVLGRRASIGWVIGFGMAFLVTMMLMTALGYLVLRRIGVWGNNNPVGWAWDI